MQKLDPELEKRFKQNLEQGRQIDSSQIKEMQAKSEEARFKRKKKRHNEDSNIQKYQDDEDIQESDQDEENDSDEDSMEQRDRFEGKIEKNEEDLKIQKIKHQLDYFGNVMEPLNMNVERGMGQVDKNGFFQMNKGNNISDPWLDQLDEQGNIEFKNMLIKRRQKGVYSDEENGSDSDQEKQNQKKIKLQESQTPQNILKQRLLQAPVFMLKQKLTQLLEDNQSPTQMMDKLKKIFNHVVPQAQKVQFKKNIRKKDKELLEQQAKQAQDEAQKNMPSEDEKETAKGQYDLILDIADAIMQRSGSSEIFTLKKEKILENLQNQMNGEKSSSSEDEEGSLSQEEEEDEGDEEKGDEQDSNRNNKKKQLLRRQYSDDDEEEEEQQNQEENENLKEGQKKVRFAIPKKKN